MNRPVVVCSCFIEKDGKFLLFFDPRFKLWRVPGGKIEGDESAEETLVREMKEETGITIENPKFLGYGQDTIYHLQKKNKVSRLLMFFHAKTEEEADIDADEAEEFKWVTIEELKKEENKEGAIEDFFSKNPNFTSQ